LIFAGCGAGGEAEAGGKIHVCGSEVGSGVIKYSGLDPVAVAVPDFDGLE
jgi:hypothetical protein